VLCITAKFPTPRQLRVKTGKAQIEHNFSARPRKADPHRPLVATRIISASSTARPCSVRVSHVAPARHGVFGVSILDTAMLSPE
jgi:hypothetical protein